MTKLVRLLIIVLAAGLVAHASVAAAAGRGNGGAPKVKAQSAKPVKVKTSSKPTAPKTTSAKPTKVSGKPAKSTAGTSAKSSKPAKGTGQSNVALNKKGTSSTTTNTSTSNDTTVVIQSAHNGPELNEKLQKKLGEDSKHAARLAAKLNLPAGMTIEQAAAGFRNWGQFNAAVNVANEQGIPFWDLRAAMTGWTPPDILTGEATQTTTGTMSLGQAQQAFKAGTLTSYPPPGTLTTTTSTTTSTSGPN